MTTEQRIQALEAIVADLQTAVNNLASKKQLQQLSLIRQAEIEELTVRMVQAENAIVLLQGG